MFPDKLQTILTYRFPNESIIEKRGVFKRLDHPELFEGFIVSDFEGSHFYGFFEGAENEIISDFESPIVISKSAYCNLADEFIHYLQDHAIGKAVLSRIKKVEFNEKERLKLFQNLCEKYPQTFCYSFDSSLLGKWIGATPEILISIEEGRGTTMSLAGTKPVNDNSPWGEKEIHEQKLVTDFIYKQLVASCEQVEVSEREELIAGPIKHLVHHFQFELSVGKEWNLIQMIHPTPAVCGFPRNEALKCIEYFEPHSRNLYAGIIGLKSTVNTKLFVNLRSAQLLNGQLFLYLGGGLTQQSVSEHEWEETENKSKTLLNLVVKDLK